MQTQLVPGASAPAAAAGGSQGGSIAQALGAGQEAGQLFTTLLVAQIRNQNPLEPTDPSEFVAQLTQLSQAESMQKLVAQSTSQVAMLKGLHALGLGAQVGSRVMVRAEAVTLESAPLQAGVSLSSGATLTAVLRGVDGREHRLPLGRQAAGDVAFTLDPVKLGLAPGRYGIAVQDESGRSLPVDVAGELEAVRVSPAGAVSLNVGPLGEVGPESVTRYLGRVG